MYSFLIIIYSIILFILFNLYLFTLNIFLLFSSALLFIYILYNLFKIEKKNIKKEAFIYSFFIILFFVYLYSFSSLKIEKIKYNFLTIDNNGSINNDTAKKILGLYGIDEYSTCIKNKCNIENYYKKDISVINTYLENNNNLLGIIKTNQELENLIKKKKLLESNGITVVSYENNFNLDDFIKTYLIGLKSYNVSYLEAIKSNIFINKNQYLNYLDNYYYEIYDLVINNNIEGIRDLEIIYNRNNIGMLLINRKYFYNYLIVHPQTIYSNLKIIKKFNENILLLK